MIATDTKLIPLADAARQYLGRPVSPATLWRWARKGVRGARLEIFRVGGRCYTTHEALAEFARATTAATLGTAPPTPAPRSETTTAKLAEAGLL